MAQDYDLMNQLFMMQQPGNGVFAPQMMAPMQSSQSSQVKIAEPITAAFQRTQRFPTSASDFEELMKRRTEGLESQRAGLADIESQIGKLAAPTNEMNLAPILAASDFLAGTQYLKNYQSPAEKQKAAQAEQLGLKLQLQKNKDALTDKEIDLYKAQYQDSFDREKLKTMSGLAQQKMSAKADMNPFETARQKTLGKAASDWVTSDRATFTSNLDKIQTADTLLTQASSSSSPLFGPLRGQAPDAIRAFTNENALIVRDSVQSAITDTLRPTLGAQFTENEGKRIMNLAVNETLSDTENQRRVRELQKVIQKKLEATDALYEYASQNNGSIQGFPFEKYNLQPEGSSAGVGGDKAEKQKQLEMLRKKKAGK